MAIAAAAVPASAGSTSGFGALRTAHLADPSNGLEATVTVPETFSGFSGYTYDFVLHGSSSTAPRAYRAAVVVSPGADTEARFNASGTGPSGPSNSTISVTIGSDVLNFTLANVPFQVELQAENGSVVDLAQYSVDLRYREPPPDGGLLQLAIASAFFWGLVFLYGLNLHLAQRKLGARAKALERSLAGTLKEVRDDGKHG